jgi:hypothetical protein
LSRLQLFFHKFFTQKLGREKAKADKVAKRKGGDDDEMSMSGDEAAVEEDLPRSNGKQAAVPEPAAADEDDSDDEEEKEIWKVCPSSLLVSGVRKVLTTIRPSIFLLPRPCKARCLTSRKMRLLLETATETTTISASSAVTRWLLSTETMTRVRTARSTRLVSPAAISPPHQRKSLMLVSLCLYDCLTSFG